MKITIFKVKLYWMISISVTKRCHFDDDNECIKFEEFKVTFFEYVFCFNNQIVK